MVAESGCRGGVTKMCYQLTLNLRRPSSLLKLGGTVVPNTVTPESIAECTLLTTTRRIIANLVAIFGF